MLVQRDPITHTLDMNKLVMSQQRALAAIKEPH